MHYSGEQKSLELIHFSCSRPLWRLHHEGEGYRHGVTSSSSSLGGRQSKGNMARGLRVTSPVRCFEPRHLSRPQSSSFPC